MVIEISFHMNIKGKSLTAVTAARSGQSIQGELSAYVARTHAGHVYVLICHLGSQGIGKGLHGMFRGGIGSPLGNGKLSLNRANEAYVTTTTFHHRRK